MLLTAGSLAENEPNLIYSTYLGGEGYEYYSNGAGVSVDAEGNIYVTGTTNSNDFPTTPGTYDTYNGNGDVFVTKFDPTGRRIIYSIYLGGSGDDYSSGIAVDSDGNVYITGGTSSFNFPTTLDAYDTTHNGAWNVFVTKINSTGTELLYSTYLGGTYLDYGTGIAIDSDGNAYVTGYAGSLDFPTTLDAYDTTHNGSGDAFVTKLNPTGTELVYSTFLGGSATYLEGIDPSYDTGKGIAVDANGNAYVTGTTHSDDFPTTLGAYDTIYKAAGDAFVAKINSTGTELVYSTFLGGWGIDTGQGIAVDADGDVYIAGFTFGNGGYPITFGAYDISHNGGCDAFITKINSSGTGLIYSTYLGGSYYDYGFAIAIDKSGNAYIVGHTFSFGGNPNDFPTTHGAYDTSYNGDADIFAAKINSLGTELIYSTYLGGSDQDSSEENQGIAVDAEGRIYVVGNTQSLDFPTTSDAYYTTYNGNGDVFVTKILISVSLTISATIGGTTDPEPGTYTYEEGTEVIVKAIPDSGYEFSSWSGDSSGTDNPITITMDSDKSVTANFKVQIPPDEPDKPEGCFIATAAYGSLLHPCVERLRNFRDKHLRTNKFGCKLIDFYYQYSPSIADFIRKHKVLKDIVRIMLWPLIAFSYLVI